MVLATATRVRKIRSTTDALSVGASTEASMITRRLSHTAKTDELNYQAIVGDMHSKTVTKVMATNIHEPLCFSCPKVAQLFLKSGCSHTIIEKIFNKHRP